MVRITAQSKAVTRERLIHTAAEHFARHGFDGANVDRISTGAGFAKGTLYNYFPSKEALFAAVIEEASRRAAALYAEHRPSGTTRECLLTLARADVQVLREQEAFTRALVREAMSFRPETYPLIVQHLAPFLAVIESTLASGVERGEVRSDAPPAQLALVFTGLLSMLYVQHWGSGGSWPALDAIPELVVGIFLEGAATRPTAALERQVATPAPPRGNGHTRRTRAGR